MRLTDEMIKREFEDECNRLIIFGQAETVIIATVRRCLALAAQPDAPSDYADVERRGFEVSQPGELPR
jgi:hypothetical protein